MKRTLAFGVIACIAVIAGCSSKSNGTKPDGSTQQNSDASTTPDATTPDSSTPDASQTSDAPTATPIKHLVVIFQENVSFDHYFGTYPTAANHPGEPPFHAATGTPTANTLTTPLDPTKGFAPITGIDLIGANPNNTNTTNTNAAKNSLASNPFRLSRAQSATADQDHDYTDEQNAFDNGKMDLFPLSTGTGDTAAPEDQTAPLDTTALTMGYYDGNTVTALWNYAQRFAMSDNSYGTMFGPSTVGALNLVAGQTHGVVDSNAATSGAGANLDEELSNDGAGGATVTGDPQPLGDVCSTRDQVRMGGKNIGDLLNDAHVTWGFFQGGFDLTITNPNGTTGCKRTSVSGVTSQTKTDYIPHHQPFQYYASTANPSHTRPSSAAAIGTSNDGGANHQYDIHDFFDAVDAGNFPAVSFLKASGIQDGHAGYSDPLDEQAFLVEVINYLERRPEWRDTAIVIAYDDSDGWYDHQMSPIVNPSAIDAAHANVTLKGVSIKGTPDSLNLPGQCTMGAQQGSATPATSLDGTGAPHVQGRCGYGPRLPLLVISPYAKSNFVDHTLTDQSSILRFIEDNWTGGKRIGGSFDALAGSLTNMFDFSGTTRTPALVLDATTGQPQACPTCL